MKRRAGTITPDEAHHADSSPREGMVTAHLKFTVEVLSDDGNIWMCHLRPGVPSLVTGDRVSWLQSGTAEGVVTGRCNRDTVLFRATDGAGRLRAVAANTDTVLVVIAPEPPPRYFLIDRYLIAAYAAGMEPVVVLNKCDLQEVTNSVAGQMPAFYAALQYRTLQVSAATGSGIETLTRWLQGRTTVLAGQSGTGKSSLINAMVPQAGLRTGTLKGSGDKASGRHTTTTARLFRLPAGGVVIDSPGVREFNPGPMESTTLLSGFHEFNPFAGRCRFANCSHQREPGCALLAALERGEIAASRLASYRALLQEIDLSASAKPGRKEPGKR